MKILLVEDNEMNRDMLVRRLSNAGYIVESATNGKTALEQMALNRPDVVLMDMNLPIMDGWTACTEAKKDSRLKNIPIVALTAHTMEIDRQLALDSGCIDYATKPIDFPDLLNKIQKAANK
tara:strand:- start:301 stop:663 length:363 start_codon:yes stop_codon:yes gene_type:complete